MLMSELTPAIFLYPLGLDPVESDPLIHFVDADLLYLSYGATKPIRQRDEVIAQRIGI